MNDVALPEPALSPEDAARVDFYALLSRLYAAPPDADLLQMLARADAMNPEGEEGEALASAWTRLVNASGATTCEAVASEYQALFVGVGKSEVSLHAAAYLTASGGNPLAQFRETLAALDLGRRRGTTLYEDHLAAVLETMRLLVERSAHDETAMFATQHDFFAKHVETWIFACCDAIQQASVANYYRHVAEFTAKFAAIERDSFAVG